MNIITLTISDLTPDEAKRLLTEVSTIKAGLRKPYQTEAEFVAEVEATATPVKAVPPKKAAPKKAAPKKAAPVEDDPIANLLGLDEDDEEEAEAEAEEAEEEADDTEAVVAPANRAEVMAYCGEIVKSEVPERLETLANVLKDFGAARVSSLKDDQMVAFGQALVAADSE